MSNAHTYGDWRDAIARHSPTSGPIPAHPIQGDAFGLWVDSGYQTAHDALRRVIAIAESWGWNGVESDYRAIVDGEGWGDGEYDSEILIDICDDAESYINAVLDGYGIDDIIPDYIRDDPTESDTPYFAYAGWDGDAGGFGLWAEPQQ